MKLNKVLKDSFNVNEFEFNESTRLMTFKEWDSMAHMFFITRLEDEFGIELNGDDIAGMQTIADIKAVIQSKGKEI